jgi:hypothetical protein
MVKHQEDLEKRYSKILMDELQKQKTISELDPRQAKLIHNLLMQFFGDTLTDSRVRDSLKRVIENATKSKEEAN